MAGGPLERQPRPRPVPPDRISPSLAEDLLTCELRLAFRLDARFSALSKPRPASALGRVSHELLMRAGRGQLQLAAHDGEDPSAVIEAAWLQLIARERERIAAAWSPSPVPPPDRWPGYQLVKTRITRLLEGFLMEPQLAAREELADWAVQTELWLMAEGTPFIGRPDRVERHGAQLEIVDFKTGLSTQEIQNSHRRQLLLYAYVLNRSTAEWPKRATIQWLDGTHVSFEVDPSEAEATAATILERMSDFRRQTEARVQPQSLAAPSASTCKHCDYRAACGPYFSSLDSSWHPYRRSVLGDVARTSPWGERVTVELTVHSTNLPTSPARARVIGLPESLAPEAGQTVAVVDALPTRSPEDVRAAWDTQLWLWT